MLTAEEQEKIFKKFKKVVDTRDSHKIDKALYNHLHLRCGFIAHYNQHGFIENYANERFLDFVEHFEQCFYLCYGEYGQFNERLKQYILENATAIRREYAIKKEQKELRLLQELAKKHNLSVVEGARDFPQKKHQPFEFTISSDGQYGFAI